MSSGGCTITSKTKINIFWKKFQARPAEWEIIYKNIDFSFWGNRATTRTHFSNYTFFWVLACCAEEQTYYSFYKLFMKIHSFIFTFGVGISYLKNITYSSSCIVYSHTMPYLLLDENFSPLFLKWSNLKRIGFLL